MLRHSFATNMVKQGHSSLNTTSIYLNFKTDEIKKTLDSFHPFSIE